jgi:hypothetical protein
MLSFLSFSFFWRLAKPFRHVLRPSRNCSPLTDMTILQTFDEAFERAKQIVSIFSGNRLEPFNVIAIRRGEPTRVGRMRGATSPSGEALGGANALADFPAFSLNKDRYLTLP